MILNKKNAYCILVTFFVLLNLKTVSAATKLTIDEDTFINLGVGLRTGFTATKDGSPNGKSYSTDFDLQNSRIYISGQLMPKIKFTFNTEKIWGDYGVLDAIVQYEPSKEFNVWMGRMLTPADRIEMNGPFYALSWNQYTNPLFPSDWSASHDIAGAYGRDEGITVWGTLNKFQYAVGLFDGYNGATNDDDSLLFASRFSYSFWNMENNPAYYTSSTYYGTAGDILTVGLSAQSQSDGASYINFSNQATSASFSAFAIDFLMEKVLTSNNVITFEGEYKSFNCKCTPDIAAQSTFTLFDGNSYFVTAAFYLSEKSGMGNLQPYVRFTSNSPDVGASSSLSELGLNYIIDGHNLRLNANVTNGDANASGYKSNDTTTFSLGIQFQI